MERHSRSVEKKRRSYGGRAWLYSLNATLQSFLARSRVSTPRRSCCSGGGFGWIKAARVRRRRALAATVVRGHGWMDESIRPRGRDQRGLRAAGRECPAGESASGWFLGYWKQAGRSHHKLVDLIPHVLLIAVLLRKRLMGAE